MLRLQDSEVGKVQLDQHLLFAQALRNHVLREFVVEFHRSRVGHTSSTSSTSLLLSLVVDNDDVDVYDHD